MLRVDITKSKSVYVTFCDDTHPNKGGYFCQVYADENCEFEIDNFVIHRNELPNVSGNERLKQAEKIANSRTKFLIRK
jgi:hypothetical protein